MRNGVTGNGVTRNCVTGFFPCLYFATDFACLFAFFLSLLFPSEKKKLLPNSIEFKMQVNVEKGFHRTRVFQ